MVRKVRNKWQRLHKYTIKKKTNTDIDFYLLKEKNIWISLIGMLGKRDLLPIVSFVFSRKRCDDNINLQSSMDLNTQAEKSEVHLFIQKSLMALSKEDRHIPQVSYSNPFYFELLYS